MTQPKTFLITGGDLRYASVCKTAVTRANAWE